MGINSSQLKRSRREGGREGGEDGGGGCDIRLFGCVTTGNLGFHISPPSHNESPVRARLTSPTLFLNKECKLLSIFR